MKLKDVTYLKNKKAVCHLKQCWEYTQVILGCRPVRLNLLLPRDTYRDLRREVQMSVCSLNLAATLLWIPKLTETADKTISYLAGAYHPLSLSTYESPQPSPKLQQSLSILYFFGLHSKDLWTWWEFAFLPYFYLLEPQMS